MTNMAQTQNNRWYKLDSIMVPLILAVVTGSGALILNMNYQVGSLNNEQSNVAQDIAEIKDEVKGFGVLKVTVAKLQQRVSYLERTVFHETKGDNNE